MQLPDEALDYHYHNSLYSPTESWTPLAELQAKHLLTRARVQALVPNLMAARSQTAADREVADPKPEQQPLQPGFIDLPQRMLDGHRRKGEQSELGRVLALAGRLRDQVDRVIVLGIGGSYMGARTLFEALLPVCHNELPLKIRVGTPRIYFEGNGIDNDALADLLAMMENNCVDPEIKDERWGGIVISKSGETLETAAAYRVFRAEAARFYGAQSPRLKQLIVPITGEKSKLRKLCEADGYKPEDILGIPDNVGGRFAVFTAVGLLPAAVMGLDVRALLLGATAMTKRFFEEPFDRNPVLQFVAVNYLMGAEQNKTMRVLSVWSKKLEALGFWYDQLLSESLGKHGQGATPITTVQSRDLHSRGQQHQDGARDKMINNVFVKGIRQPAIALGMAERNEDDLNALSRTTYPQILQAAFDGTNQAYRDVARPTADIVLPALNEHTLGQVLQMLMLATVVEGKLLGVNPYGQPGVEAYKKNMMRTLRGG